MSGEPLTREERLAQAFHEAYERLAPSFGYATREESAVPWSDVPEPNRSLMVAVAKEIAVAAEAERDALRRDLSEYLSRNVEIARRVEALRASLAEIVADHLSDCPCDSIAWAAIKADNARAFE